MKRESTDKVYKKNRLKRFSTVAMFVLKDLVVILVVCGIMEIGAHPVDCNCGRYCTQAIIHLKDTQTGEIITYPDGCGLCVMNCGQPGSKYVIQSVAFTGKPSFSRIRFGRSRHHIAEPNMINLCKFSNFE